MNQKNQQIQVPSFGPDTALTCGTPKCGSRLLARAAFNGPVDLRTASREDVIRAAICDDCARRKQIRNKLLVTLDLIDRRGRQRREHASYRNWAERGNRQREREALNAQLMDYARWVGQTDTVHVSGRDGNILPKTVEFGAGSTELMCGLPRHLRCCAGGNNPARAKDFAVMGGQVVGLCGLAGYTFRNVRKELRNSDRRALGLNRLRTYETQDAAEIVAAHERGEHAVKNSTLRYATKSVVEANLDCPICNRPNNRRG